MKVTVRQRKYRDRVAWSADIHVVPAGEQATERFRIAAPSTMTSRSGAERWAMEQARRIAAHGRPVNNRKARAARAEAVAAAARERVPLLREWWIRHIESQQLEGRKPSGMDSKSSIWKCATGAALERGGAARAVPPR